MSAETAALPNSLWAATAAALNSCQELPNSVRTHHLIIGAGYVGLSTALHLLEKGEQDVLVIDSAEPGWGASGRNGGQIISGLKQLPSDLRATFGKEVGDKIIKGFGSSGELLYSLVERYNIDCNLVKTGWIQVAHADKSYINTLVPRHQEWCLEGIQGRLLNRDEVAGLVGSSKGEYVGGWFDPRGGTLQPLSYARGLANSVMAMGGRIIKHCPALSMERSGAGYLIKTPSTTINAAKVIIATNAYTGSLVPGLSKTVVPVTSFQLATKPLSVQQLDSILPGRQGITDTRRLLHYFRLDGDGRLLMGGRCPVEDAPTFHDAKNIYRALTKTFPQVEGIEMEYVWSGKVALTKDSMPHIHILEPNLFAALGCNGRGVANATFLGREMAALVSGACRDTLSCPITALDPFAFHAFRRVGIVATSTYYQMLDKLEMLRTKKNAS